MFVRMFTMTTAICTLSQKTDLIPTRIPENILRLVNIGIHKVLVIER